MSLFGIGQHVRGRRAAIPTGPFGVGTSFPMNPLDGDLFYRTDLGLLCFYKSSASSWLTVNEYSLTNPVGDALLPVTVTNANVGAAPINKSQAGVWMERVIFATYIGGTSSGSHYWTVQPYSKAAGGGTTNLGSSFNTSADTGSTWVTHTVTVGAAVTSTHIVYQFSATKTGTGGSLYWACEMIYRLIVT